MWVIITYKINFTLNVNEPTINVNEPTRREGFWAYKLDTFIPKGFNLRYIFSDNINFKGLAPKR